MNNPQPDPAASRSVMELLIPAGLLVVWLILQIWVLPRFGFRT